MSMSVCLSVCNLFVNISETACPIFTKFLCMLHTYGPGSVLWQRCESLGTSGFYTMASIGVSKRRLLKVTQQG